jgi:hypothetical protein
MAMKNAGMTICALLVLVSTSWGTTAKPPKKFHTGGGPHPHHPLAQTERAGHAPSSGASTVSPKSQSAREREVERLEHQNVTYLQAQSRQRSKAARQAPHILPEPTGRGPASTSAITLPMLHRQVHRVPESTEGGSRPA